MMRLKKGPMEQFRRRKCKLRNHKTLKLEQLRRWRYRQKNHWTSNEGIRKRENHGELKDKDKWRLFQQ
jgi:hypothetical protein